MKKSKYWEKLYPTFFSILVGILLIIYTEVTSIYPELEKILEGAITFSSIIIGFLATMLGILYTIRNSEIIENLFNHYEKRDTFLNFFKQSIISGLLVVIISSILFLDGFIPNVKLLNLEIKTLEYLFIFWSVIFTFFIFSSYRIIDVLMIIILKKSTATSNEPQGELLDENKANKLKKQLSK